MNVVENTDYEELGSEFQLMMIQLLNDNLKKFDIPLETRREICGDFAFDFSMLLDQGEVENTVPKIAFYNEENDTLNIGSSTFDYHEYAYGNTDAIFEEDEEEEED